MSVYRTQKMSAAQASTSSFVIVDESILVVPPGASTVAYLVQEEGGSNDVTAKLAGRFIDAGKGVSDWEDTGVLVDVPAGEARPLMASGEYDQSAVFITNTGASAGSAKVFGTAREGVLSRLMPSRVRFMSADQVTTNSFVIVPESRVRVDGHNWVRYRVNNTDDTNSVVAVVRGRYLNAGEASAWEDVSAEATIGTETFTSFEHGPRLKYDEYAVFVKAASAGNQGDVKVFGGARHQPDSVDDEAALTVTRVIASESNDTITVSYQFSRRETLLVHVTGYKGVQATAGDLEEEADAALTMSDGTDGTTLLGDDTHAALFQTTNTGALDVIYTDVAGASSKEFINAMREGGANGPLIELPHVISFDGS